MSLRPLLSQLGIALLKAESSKFQKLLTTLCECASFSLALSISLIGFLLTTLVSFLTCRGLFVMNDVYLGCAVRLTYKFKSLTIFSTSQMTKYKLEISLRTMKWKEYQPEFILTLCDFFTLE